MRRLAAHRAVGEALAAGAISVSWAREICAWTDLLPAGASGDADLILLAAAAAGAELADLAGLAEELRKLTARPDQDGGDDGFDDRSVRLATHYRGAGRLDGDLTPRCAAALQAVLDALGKKAGPEDTRTRSQRSHDALEEACRRLIAAQCLPDRAGQPTQIQLVMTLDQLTRLNPTSTTGTDTNDAGTGWPGGGWPGTGGGWPGSGWPGTGGTGSSWIGPGPLAGPGDDCDASIAPVVTGHVDYDLLDRLGQAYARELILRDAVALLSGPAGLASYLRTTRLTGPAAAASLPLDAGAATDTIPAHLRRAVIARDRRCAFPGGCDQLPAACQVHHIIPRSEGGPTTLTNLGLFCTFHHLIVIHRWGWTLTLHADGTITATSPDGIRTLHTHDPPASAA